MRYGTTHGLPAYDAARWLAPPPPVRSVRRLPSGLTTLLQEGGSSLAGATQEALVQERGLESLLLFPDGTRDFDLHLGPERRQPEAPVGLATMGADTIARWVARPTATRMIQIHLPVGFRTETLHGKGATFDGRYATVRKEARGLVRAYSELLESGVADDLLLDSYAIVVVDTLTRLAPDGHARDGRLAGWQVRRATEMLSASIGSTVSLAEVAATVGLSPVHFSRAFRNATGQSPFAWLQEEKIRAAMRMLRDTPLPLSEVALAAGFAAQSSFTTAFRQVTGATPGAWRRDHARMTSIES